MLGKYYNTDFRACNRQFRLVMKFEHRLEVEFGTRAGQKQIFRSPLRDKILQPRKLQNFRKFFEGVLSGFRLRCQKFLMEISTILCVEIKQK